MDISRDRVFIEGLRISGKHGVHAHEQANEQMFLIDMSATFETKGAGTTDDLKDTIDYGKLRALAKRIIEGSQFFLLERVAETIAAEALLDERIVSISIKIRKASVYDDCVPGVEIFRSRT